VLRNRTFEWPVCTEKVRNLRHTVIAPFVEAIDNLTKGVPFSMPQPSRRRDSLRNSGGHLVPLSGRALRLGRESRFLDTLASARTRLGRTNTLRRFPGVYLCSFEEHV